MSSGRKDVLTSKDLESFGTKFANFYSSLPITEQAVLDLILAHSRPPKLHSFHRHVLAGFADGAYIWIDGAGHIHVEPGGPGPYKTELKDHLAGFIVEKPSTPQEVKV